MKLSGLISSLIRLIRAILNVVLRFKSHPECGDNEDVKSDQKDADESNDCFIHDSLHEVDNYLGLFEHSLESLNLDGALSDLRLPQNIPLTPKNATSVEKDMSL